MSALSWASAAEMARNAVEAAEAAGRSVAVVVLDASATEVAVLRHHGAYMSAPQIARAKAFTALNFKAPTHVMAERLGSIDYAVQIALADPRLAFIKGGLPLVVDGTVIGSIGVSGASADEDLAFGTAAAAAAGLSA